MNQPMAPPQQMPPQQMPPQQMPPQQMPPQQMQYHPGQLKSKIVAGILGILIGSLGIHNFYLGRSGRGLAQIIVTFVTLGIGGLWGFIEGIMILVSNDWTDGQGRPMKEDVQQRPPGY